MTANNCVIEIGLRLLGLPPNTQPTNIVVTAAGYQHVIEVAEADRAVVFEFVAQGLGFVGVLGGVSVDELDVGLLVDGVDADLVSFFHLLNIHILYLLQYPLLVINILLLIVSICYSLQRAARRLVDKPELIVTVAAAACCIVVIVFVSFIAMSLEGSVGWWD